MSSAQNWLHKLFVLWPRSLIKLTTNDVAELFADVLDWKHPSKYLRILVMVHPGQVQGIFVSVN